MDATGLFFITMNSKPIDELKNSVTNFKEWLTLEVEYLKLTAAEKVSILLSTVILLLLLFIVGLVVMIVFAFALVDLFNLFMPHALACVTVGGIFLLLVGLLYLLRNPLVVSPITKLITKLFLSSKKS